MTVAALQVPTELDWMTTLFRKKQPQRILEIGVWEGGTLEVWLKHAPPDAHVVAVDLAHPNESSYGEWRQSLQTIRVVTGSSQDESVKEVVRLNAPYDWAFVDGDHHTDAVWSDVLLVLPLVRAGGMIVLHDIVSGSANLLHEGPGAALERLKDEGYLTTTFVAQTDVDEAHGVGVVQL